MVLKTPCSNQNSSIMWNFACTSMLKNTIKSFHIDNPMLTHNILSFFNAGLAFCSQESWLRPTFKRRKNFPKTVVFHRVILKENQEMSHFSMFFFHFMQFFWPTTHNLASFYCSADLVRVLARNDQFNPSFCNTSNVVAIGCHSISQLRKTRISTIFGTN